MSSAARRGGPRSRPRRPGQQRLRLGPGGDEEVAAAGRCEPLDDLARAEPIAVGLDRRAAGGAAALLRQPAPVGDQRLAVEHQAQGERAGPGGG